MESPQTTTFIQLPSVAQKRIDTLKFVMCIDISGSTSGKLQNNLSIIENEVAIAKKIIAALGGTVETSPDIIAWDNSASVCLNIDSLRHHGGTSPVCMLDNSTTALLSTKQM
jgi:hypothetical protein